MDRKLGHVECEPWGVGGPLEPMHHTAGGGAGARELPSEPRTGTTAAKAVPTKFQIDTPPQLPRGVERTPEEPTTVCRNAEGNLRFLFDSPGLLRTGLGIDIDPTVDNRFVLGLDTSDGVGPPDLTPARVSAPRELLTVGQRCRIRAIWVVR